MTNNQYFVKQKECRLRLNTTNDGMQTTEAGERIFLRHECRSNSVYRQHIIHIYKL